MKAHRAEELILSVAENGALECRLLLSREMLSALSAAMDGIIVVGLITRSDLQSVLEGIGPRVESIGGCHRVNIQSISKPNSQQMLEMSVRGLSPVRNPDQLATTFQKLCALLQEPQARQMQNDWKLDVPRRALSAPDGRRLGLTPLQLEQLAILAKTPRKVMSIREMAEALRMNYLDCPETRLYTQVSRLRSKLAEFDESLTIRNWRCAGYSYVGPPIQFLGESMD